MEKREIKFRAWSKGSKFMYNAIWIGSLNGMPAVALDGRNPNKILIKQVPELILMQYTGLKDKRGVEIYERDIVKWRHKEEIIGEEIGEVMFRSGIFWVEVIKESSRGQLRELYRVQNKNYQVVKEEAEVIGNIYENPKLLTNK